MIFIQITFFYYLVFLKTRVFLNKWDKKIAKTRFFVPNSCKNEPNSGNVKKVFDFLLKFMYIKFNNLMIK